MKLTIIGRQCSHNNNDNDDENHNDNDDDNEDDLVDNLKQLLTLALFA